MDDSARKSIEPAGPPFETGDDYPETSTFILHEAAAGRWDTFLAAYLRPCWREVVLCCAGRGIPLLDAEDLFQELMLRVLRHSGFSGKVEEELGRLGEAGDFRANLPGRYLKYREVANLQGLSIRSTRFRAYLKGVVENLVLELIRQRRREPKPIDSALLESAQPWIERSITLGMDRAWRAQCLEAAIAMLREECAEASTKGRRRLYDLLYLNVVGEQSGDAIAKRLGLNRTTVSSLLKQARARLAALLSAATGIADPAELRALVAGCGEELKVALADLGPLAKLDESS